MGIGDGSDLDTIDPRAEACNLLDEYMFKVADGDRAKETEVIDKADKLVGKAGILAEMKLHSAAFHGGAGITKADDFGDLMSKAKADKPT